MAIKEISSPAHFCMDPKYEDNL